MVLFRDFVVAHQVASLRLERKHLVDGSLKLGHLRLVLRQQPFLRGHIGLELGHRDAHLLVDGVLVHVVRGAVALRCITPRLRDDLGALPIQIFQ